MRQDGARQLDQARVAMAQRDASWQAQDAKLRGEMDAQAKRFKTRWRVVMFLWLVVFVAVAADLALALAK